MNTNNNATTDKLTTQNPQTPNGNGASAIATPGTIEQPTTPAAEPLNNHALPSTDLEPWPEPVDGATLLDNLQRLLVCFVILPKWAAETLALWIIHTYAFELRNVSTYLGIESPQKRCGKTTLLTLLSELVNRPVVASNISSPAFFRIIEETRPTLLIDEADTVLWRNDELRGILNSGYSRKTAFVVRVTGEPRTPENGFRNGEDAAPDEPQRSSPRSCTGTRLARFSCWCPKAIAAIGHLPETLADRCIVIRMQRKSGTEQCERLRNLEATPLRRQCLRFVTDHAREIAAARPQLPAELNDRAADIWEPLLALADLAGDRWPQLARQAAVGLSVAAQESSAIGSLFLDIFARFVFAQLLQQQEGAKPDLRMFSRTLVEKLNALGDRPWTEARRGKPINEVWLARELNPYGIRPKTLWIGEQCAKGYYEEDFREVFRRYVPKSEVEEMMEEWGLTRTKGPKGADAGEASRAE